MRDEGAELLKRMLLFAMAIGGTVWFVVAIFLPAWKLALGLDSGWTVLGLLVGGGMLGSRLNIPTPFRSGNHRVAVNVFGALAPIAVSVWIGLDLRPGLALLPLVLAPLVAVIDCKLSKATPIGVVMKRRDLYLLTLGLVVVLSLSALTVREVMWWSFTILYCSGLATDFYHLSRHGDAFDLPPHLARLLQDQLPDGARTLSIGGAGSNDALWVGPALSVTAAWVIDWLIT